MTYKERFEFEHANWSATAVMDYMRENCPVTSDGTPDYCQFDASTWTECGACWDREIPETPATDPEPTDPTPILDEAINPLHITFYPANIPNPDEMLANVINIASAIKDRPVYITIM